VPGGAGTALPSHPLPPSFPAAVTIPFDATPSPDVPLFAVPERAESLLGVPALDLAVPNEARLRELLAWAMVPRRSTCRSTPIRITTFSKSRPSRPLRQMDSTSISRSATSRSCPNASMANR